MTLSTMIRAMSPGVGWGGLRGTLDLKRRGGANGGIN